MKIWPPILGMSILGANQPCLQRSCALRTLEFAHSSALLGGVLLALFTILSALVGMVIFAYYTKEGCDPVQVIHKQ